MRLYDEVFYIYFKILSGQFDENKLIKEKASYASESIKSVGTPAIKVVVDIVKKYHGKLPMAVASSGMREHVLESLRTNDLEKVYCIYLILFCLFCLFFNLKIFLKYKLFSTSMRLLLQSRSQIPSLPQTYFY